MRPPLDHLILLILSKVVWKIGHNWQMLSLFHRDQYKGFQVLLITAMILCCKLIICTYVMFGITFVTGNEQCGKKKCDDEYITVYLHILYISIFGSQGEDKAKEMREVCPESIRYFGPLNPSMNCWPMPNRFCYCVYPRELTAFGTINVKDKAMSFKTPFESKLKMMKVK